MGYGNDHSRDGSLTGGLILVGIGTLFLLKKLGIFPGLDIGDLWPLILIIVGLALIVGYFRRINGRTPTPPTPPESS
jgi:hypothetical protein